MNSRDFYYINSNFETNEIFTCGARFSEFLEFITIKPENILLMQAAFWAGKWHAGTSFEYADNENMQELLSDYVYGYGNFCWVDFDDKKSIDSITPVELSELLYISHKFEPLHSPFFERIKNNYAYLAHDDDYWTKIYMRDIHDYAKVIEGKIIKGLRGRRKHMESIPIDIMDLIFDNTVDGILIDFPNVFHYEGGTGVSIYKLGRHISYYEIRDIHERKRGCLGNHITLEYYNKKWRIYGEWK